MKKNFILLAMAALVSACGNNTNTGNNSEGKQLSGTIKIDGSSTLFPMSEAVAEEFRNVSPQLNVTVGESGTGGGFKKFYRGEIDIVDASRPIKSQEMEACQEAKIEFIELPVVYDGITIVVSKQNTFINNITTTELKTLWEASSQGKVITWNQVRSSWPNEKIALYGPGTASGTYDYFTEVICGKSGSSRGDYTASTDPNVLVKGISADKNGLGFFGFSYYEHNSDKLKAVPVFNGNEAIIPSFETIQNGQYIPLSRPLFIYVNAEAAKRREVAQFIDYYLSEVFNLAQEAGYISLSDNEIMLVQDRFNQRILGSCMNNSKGFSLTQALQQSF